jgi:uncharacterized membrane protein YfcA
VSLQAWELLALGTVTGAFGALLGIGGGVILVPALSLIAGLQFRSAVAASLVSVVATSVAASGVHLARGRIDLDAGLELQFFTVAGAVLAGLLAAFIPARPLYFAFAALLVYTAWHMFPRARPAAVRPVLRTRWAASGASVGAGLVSGLLGVGGGLINTPVLHPMLGIPLDRAIATSAYMIGLTAAASALIYFARGDVNIPVTAPTMLGTLLGSAVAAAVGHRVQLRLLRILLVVLLAYVAIEMTRRGLGAP